MNQLKYGIKEKSEHRHTIDYIKDACKKGKCPTDKQVFTHIAKDHLSENSNYYKKIKKYKL